MAFLAVQNLSAIFKLKVTLQFNFIDASVFAISAVLHLCVEMGNLFWFCIIIHKFTAKYLFFCPNPTPPSLNGLFKEPDKIINHVLAFVVY